MSRDPILDDVHAIRDAIAKEHDYDLASIFGMLRARGQESTRAHVSPVPPAVTNIATAAAQQGAAPDRGTEPPRSAGTPSESGG